MFKNYLFILKYIHKFNIFLGIVLIWIYSRIYRKKSINMKIGIFMCIYTETKKYTIQLLTKMIEGLKNNSKIKKVINRMIIVIMIYNIINTLLSMTK